VAVSASTLAEDVRQLAQWCRSADDARDQQESRLEQLERMPPLQAQLKALQDKASPLHSCCPGPHLIGIYLHELVVKPTMHALLIHGLLQAHSTLLLNRTPPVAWQYIVLAVRRHYLVHCKV